MFATPFSLTIKCDLLENALVGIGSRSVTKGDFNGDGLTDLAAANTFSDEVSVLLGNGDGTFKDQQTFSVGDRPTSVTTGDFNGDGLTDLATGNFHSSDVSVLLGNGDGTFLKQQTFTVGSGPSITTGDFNGDGLTDLATANFYSNDVSVLLNQCSGDKAVDVAPDSFQVSAGNFVGGGLSELANSDDADLAATRSNTDVQSRVFVELKSTSPT